MTQIQALQELCFATAQANGKTRREARRCEMYSVGCQDCPLQSEAWKSIDAAIEEIIRLVNEPKKGKQA